MSATILKQRQAIRISRPFMPLIRCLFEPAFGHLRVGRNAATKPIGLPEIILRIGIARDCQRAPYVDRCRKVAAGIGINPCLDVGTCW